MRIKFLNLQMVMWSCVHLMGNKVSCVPFQRSVPRPAVGTIKLMKSDGQIQIYHRPVYVSELMLEFPKHMVCRSDSFYIGQKVPALSEDDQLQLGHNYFLLPNHFFQSVLSFVTIASFAATAAASPSPLSSSSVESKSLFLRKASNCQPFDIQKTPSGCLRIKVSEEFLSQLLIDQRVKRKEAEEGGGESVNSSGGESTNSKLCTTAQLRKDYAQLVGSRQWKPKLETIRESKDMRKLSSFAMKIRKNSQLMGALQSSNRRSAHSVVGLLELPRSS